MTELEPSDSTARVDRDSRNRRLRRRSLRRSSSEDVIVIDSPMQAETSRAARRRRRVIRSPESNTSIVDLTCAPDEVVDLTSPDIIQVQSYQPAPLEISDEETDDVQQDSPMGSPPHPALSCPVCLEKFSKIIKAGGQIKSTMCGHVFCNVCIHTAILHSKKCPTCRKKLDTRKVHTLYLPM